MKRRKTVAYRPRHRLLPPDTAEGRGDVRSLSPHSLLVPPSRVVGRCPTPPIAGSKVRIDLPPAAASADAPHWCEHGTPWPVSLHLGQRSRNERHHVQSLIVPTRKAQRSGPRRRSDS